VGWGDYWYCKIDDLKGEISAFGEDGLEATKIAIAVHESIEKEKEIKIGG
jgi:hypothetical protein